MSLSAFSPVHSGSIMLAVEAIISQSGPWESAGSDIEQPMHTSLSGAVRKVRRLADYLSHDTFQEVQAGGFQELSIAPEGYQLMPQLAPEALRAAVDLQRSTAGTPLEKLKLVSRRPIAISIDTRLCFRRTVELPQLQKSMVSEALRLDLMRVAPFDPATVLVAHRILGEAEERSSQLVEQIVVRRSIILPLISWLEQKNLAAKAIVFRDSEEGILPVALGLDGSPYGARRHSQRLKIMAGSLAALLLTGVIGNATASWKVAAQREDISARVGEVKSPADKVLDAVNTLKSSSTKLAALVSWKEQAVSIPSVIEELSRLLPDDSYLDGVSVEGNEMVIDGQSKVPEALITVFEASPLFENAAFAAPVFRNADENYSRFSLRMKISVSASAALGR
jgi:general secretion pathway protein L